MEYRKLDEKIKELNSTRVFKKVTPKFDLYFSFVGTIGWLWVGILWHDRALIMLNGALATLLFTGILKAYIV